jgi:hypothetical protein
VWGNKAGVKKLDDEDFPVLRPANYPCKKTPGRGYTIIEDANNNRILIINLMGLVFMKFHLECPFKVIDKILEEHSDEDLAGVIVDFHAETTSEKYALGYYLAGKVSAVIGTHTHIPTADAGIFEGGTAFITDVGMVGPTNSIIGLKKDLIIDRFLTQMPAKHEPETEGEMVFSAVLIELDENTKKALNIKHILKFI